MRPANLTGGATMITKALVRAFIGVIHWVFSLLPNGPTITLSAYGPYKIPAPSWLYPSLNSATATPFAMLLGLWGFGAAYELVRRVAKLVLGNRGDAL